MNAPRRPDGPPVRDGKPYSAIAHLAEDIVPYVAIASGLRDRNLSAPAILDADLERGLLIMEDLGTERIVGGDPRRRSRSATKPRSTCWCRCIAADCRRPCRWRRAATIGYRATICRHF